MRISIGRDGWCFFDGRDEPGSESARFRGNESAALQWLEQFQNDFAAMSALRTELSKQAGGKSFNDGEVLQTVAGNLASGRWHLRRGSQVHPAGSASARSTVGVVFELDGPDLGPPGIGPGPGGETVEFGPAFPLEQRRRFAAPSAGSEGPQSLFPNDADLKAIADGQKRAAERGAALCEECLKAQAATGGA